MTKYTIKQTEALSAKIEHENIAERDTLFNVIARAQSLFIRHSNRHEALNSLLQDVLHITASEYGFIGEVLYTALGEPYLKVSAITDISWNEQTRVFYATNAHEGLEFRNLNTLFGAALVSGEPVIANDPYNDPRRGGLPEGHPPLNAFLGIPIYIGQKLVAMVGLANRDGGYHSDLVDFLKPLLQTISIILENHLHSEEQLTLKKELQRLSSVASQTTNAVVITDVAGNITWVNGGFCRLTGYTLQDVLDQKPGDILQGPDTDPETVAEMRTALESGESFNVDIINYAKDNTPYWVRIICNSLQNEHGEAEGIIAIQSNITEEKQAQRLLHERSERTTQQQKLIAELSSNDTIANGSIDEQLAIIVNKLSTNLLTDRVNVWMLAEDNTQLQRKIFYNASPDLDSQIAVLNAGDLVSYFAALNTETQIDATDAQNDPRTKEMTVNYLAPLQICSLLDTAIQQDGGLIGVLSVVHCGSMRKWHDDEKTFLSAITSLIAQLLANAERKKAEDLTKEAYAQLERLGNQVPGALYQFELSLDGTMFMPYASRGIKLLYDVEPEQVRHDATAGFNAIHLDDIAEVMASIQESARTLDVWMNKHRVTLPDGRTIWIEGEATPTLMPNGSVIWHGYLRDITERKQAENELKIAATAFESQEGMMVCNAHDIILRVNRAFTKITGYTAEEAMGQTPLFLHSNTHGKTFYTAMRQELHDTGEWKGEVWRRRKSGEIHPEQLAITAVKDAAGIIINYVTTFTDITDSKSDAKEIEQLAFYDPLTQLANRRLLLNRLDQAQTASARSGQQGALLFIDLDHFKTLNDTQGHSVGDLLLQQVAQRLTANVRQTDTVSRFGGDEFVVLLEGLSGENIEAAVQIEEIAQKIMLALNQPYHLNTQIHHATPSIGITTYNGREQEAGELLKQADIAMYQSKTDGRNVCRFFLPEMQEAITALAGMQQELRKAIEQNQFELHYQIQVDATGQAIGAEALIRWHHPERGMISPFHFIPIAEQTGLILPIGQWVLETACAQIKSWQHNPLTSNLVISINVSATQFHQENYIVQVLETIQRHAINPAQLKLELTESMLVENIDEIITKMKALNQAGIRFSLDDFGTGYSSLRYLKMLPIDELKIDQSFVRDIGQGISDREIVTTIISMAQGLNIGIIAEGVETEEQRQFLFERGCMRYQGYLFGKPVPVAQFQGSLIVTA